MPVPRYISAEEYAKRSGLSPKKVKDMCKVGKLDFYMTEGGYYKIKEDDNNSVSKDLYEKEKERRIKAETTLELVKNILNKEGVKYNEIY